MIAYDYSFSLRFIVCIGTINRLGIELNMITASVVKQNKIIKIWQKLTNSSYLLGQLAGYTVSGCIATLVHFTVLITLAELGGVDSSLSTCCGLLCGAIAGFTLNRRFVFGENTAWKMACLQYLVMSFASAGVNFSYLA